MPSQLAQSCLYSALDHVYSSYKGLLNAHAHVCSQMTAGPEVLCGPSPELIQAICERNQWPQAGMLSDCKFAAQSPHLQSVCCCLMQMCRGLSSAERAQLGIPEGERGAATFAYLAKSGCISIPGTDDARDFQEVKNAMATVGIDATGQAQIWQLLAGAVMCSSSPMPWASCLMLDKLQHQSYKTYRYTKDLRKHQADCLVRMCPMQGALNGHICHGACPQTIRAQGKGPVLTIGVLGMSLPGSCCSSLLANHLAFKKGSQPLQDLAIGCLKQRKAAGCIQGDYSMRPSMPAHRRRGDNVSKST